VEVAVLLDYTSDAVSAHEWEEKTITNIKIKKSACCMVKTNK